MAHSNTSSPHYHPPVIASAAWQLSTEILITIGGETFELRYLVDVLGSIEAGKAIVIDQHLAQALMRTDVLDNPGVPRAHLAAKKGPAFDTLLDDLKKLRGDVKTLLNARPSGPGWQYARPLSGPVLGPTCVEIVSGRHGDLAVRHLGGLHHLDDFQWLGAIPVPEENGH